MQKIDAITYLAGIEKEEIPQADAPTNIHVITGEVSENSEDGIARIEIDGFVISGDDDDEQSIEIDTLGGLEEGDTATILLAGETGKAMTPLAIGGVGSIDRINARVKEIEADYVKADVLEANYAHITEGVIDNATIDQAKVNNLSANYAKVDAANITGLTARNAWIDALMVQSGLIAHEGAIYTLDAIQVNASNITAGTIDVERLIVTVEGEKYFVSVDPTTSQPVYQKLDGDVIEDLTITADKIVAGAITAEKITTENIVGTGGWINLHRGTFAYVNEESGNGIVWDGEELTISGRVVIGDQSRSLIEIAEAAEEAQQTANDIPIVTLSSTNGTVFKNSSGVSTTVIATIYTPGGIISTASELHSRFGNGAYLEWGWRDVVTDEDHTLLITDPRISRDGFALTVSPEDVDGQVVIRCYLYC